MLSALSIRDIVLIDRLDLTFERGLCALTGETGAGKSIVLDALGLALGARADRGLVRAGASEGIVVATFAAAPGHPVWPMLAEGGVETDPVSGEILLKRIQGSDGRSRAFINDQPVSVALLARAGETLVEVHGQHDDRGLLDPASHRALLDSHGGLEDMAARTATAWQAWQEAVARHDALAADIESASRERDYLAHALEELDALNPAEGEEETLANERTLMMNAEKIAGDLDEAAKLLGGDGGMESRLSGALKRLERVAEKAQGRIDPAIAAIERALLEAAEASTAVANAAADLDFDPARLEKIEERLFALRALARKHRVAVDALPALRADIAEKLHAIEDGAGRLDRLASAAREAEQNYLRLARALSEKRVEAARALDDAVAAELAPLKLERAVFRTAVTPAEERHRGAAGIDRVRFEVATNPGAPMGPLTQIASGGEMARFVLALKVALAARGDAVTLVFDEVDRGVGGAVADAVGERLARLAGTMGAQVLVVTHSPQVAARAGHQWRIEKALSGGVMTTRVTALDAAARREEIARMLAGAEITEEARAAADRLLALGADSTAPKPKRRKAS